MDKNIQPPVQYQKGYTEFYKLKFHLTPDVLIPRPETELLVDEALRTLGSDRLLKQQDGKGRTLIDIGTGSGCIAISIVKNLKGVRVVATDISEKALKVAQKNSHLHHTDKQILFLQSDLLSWVNPEGLKTNPDIIVANLPYIPTSRLLHIDPMVSEFEPRLALDGGKDGFELYRRLFQQVSLLSSQKPAGVATVPPRGWKPKYLIAEIDDSQAEIALAEVKRFFPKASAEVKKDLAKLNRILKIKF
ncbi:peptide chain release factor N(5)-glutamine methyltransferase [Candidatus Daviesbacteria bacterium]|nr:peptide chain release factor N(5)-glutamine methyltransferase [Candidatus Daviesbacteria bacterium]